MPPRNKELTLYTEPTMQGQFDLQPVNLMLAFQVNCPGCFIYALPLAEKLHHRYADSDVGLLGLSTMFEDFALNTTEATQALLEHGTLVGATQHYFSRSGHQTYPNTISIPIAMDQVGPNGVGRTFAENSFRGTPTWVLFDDQSQILATWFGHRDPAEVIEMLDSLV